MKPKPAIAKQLEQAQLHIVERALIAWIEDVDGKVPSDTEILEQGFWAHFAATSLSVLEKDGQRFNQYYVWRKKHVLACQFCDPQKPLVLYVVRVPEEQWPVALKLYIKQYKAKKEDNAGE
jgi:hypothetical protein